MKYKILADTDYQILELQVNRLLSENWILRGDLICHISSIPNGTLRFIQVLVKVENNNEHLLKGHSSNYPPPRPSPENEVRNY